ncbi:MAG TPA: hypothetical protein VGO16_04870 [Pseudonocardiaceae bacterium]|nr:hypothetical protein [Pseudonocardiaceae bacterium]
MGRLPAPNPGVPWPWRRRTSPRPYLMVVAVGALYARYSGLAVVQSLVYGIAPP